MSKEQEEELLSRLFKILEESVTSVAELMKDGTVEEAQTMVDYLSTILYRNDNEVLATMKNPVLTLLCKVAVAHRIVPSCLRLEPIQYDREEPFYCGRGCDVYKTESAGGTVCVKALHSATRKPAKLSVHVKELILCTHISHSNILSFYGVFYEENDLMRIVGPWLGGGNLSAYIRSTRDPQAYRAHFIVDVLQGLSYLHGLGIVHGNLKAGCILLSADNQAFITDFASSHISTPSEIWGKTNKPISYTPNFAAPEMLENKQPTPACDVWSFGGLCYEILSRRMPFEGKSLMQILAAVLVIKGLPERLSDADADWIDDTKWDFIKKMCWAWNPEERPDCQAALRIVKGWLNLGRDDRSGVKKTPKPSSIKPKSTTSIRLDRVDELLHDIQAKLKLAESKRKSSIRDPRFGVSVERVVTREDLKGNDVVIAVMGPTGVGKSTFIQTVSGAVGSGYDHKEVGHDLRSATSTISGVRICLPDNVNVVLVDTPGFDDTKRTDFDILGAMIKWFGNVPGREERTAGILYLHRITDVRITRAVAKNFNRFQSLCGKNFFSRVVLTTTMWPTPENPFYNEEEEQCEDRERELKKDFWRPMMELGSTVHRFKLTEPDSAWIILNHIMKTHWELKGGPNTETGNCLHGLMVDLVSRQSELLKDLKQELAKSNGQDPNVINEIVNGLSQQQEEMGKHIKGMREWIRR